jgi:hypothetical protein
MDVWRGVAGQSRTWYSFSSPANWGVKPHFEAVLTTRTTLPLSCAREYSLPFSVLC